MLVHVTATLDACDRSNAYYSVLVAEDERSSLQAAAQFQHRRRFGQKLVRENRTHTFDCQPVGLAVDPIASLIYRALEAIRYCDYCVNLGLYN